VALGQHAQAVKEADGIQAAPFFGVSPGAPSIMSRLACIYTGSADAVEEIRRPAALTPEDQKLIAQYREKALLSVDFVVAHADNGYLSGWADPDVLSSLRGEPRYEALVERIKAAMGLATDPALAAVLKTLKSDPRDAKALGEFAGILRQKKAWNGAIVAYRKIIALDPKDLAAHYNLGLASQTREDTDGAIAAFRKTIALDPKHAAAHYHLGLALKSQGKVKEAQQALQRGHELGSQQAGWSYPSAEELHKIDRLVELERQLPAFLQGNRQPVSPAELLELTQMCLLTHRCTAAAHFSAAAFTAQPSLADDLDAGHRYNAACSAALAAAGQGEDAAKLDDKERARLRKQALDWLRADLALRRKQLERDKPADRATVQQKLKHWQQDTDLAGIRDKAALAKLPASEREALQKLWDDVAATLEKAAERR
jgi:tetratricopeptide (TPR) repeat protein